MYPHRKRAEGAHPAHRPSERTSAVASGGEQSALVLVVRRKVRFAATASGIREAVLRGNTAVPRPPTPDSRPRVHHFPTPGAARPRPPTTGSPLPDAGRQPAPDPRPRVPHSPTPGAARPRLGVPLIPTNGTALNLLSLPSQKQRFP